MAARPAPAAPGGDRRRLFLPAGLLLASLCGPGLLPLAHAGQELAAEAAAEADGMRREDRLAAAQPAMTVERTRLGAGAPTFETNGGGSAASTGNPSGEATAVTYRWWLLQGNRAHLGIGFGGLGSSYVPIDGAGHPVWQPLASTLTFGMRYRLGERSTVFADASSARRLAGDAGTELYSAKVGVEWATARSRLGFDKGTLGLKFDSGYRMQLRIRHGGIGLYMRGQF